MVIPPPRRWLCAAAPLGGSEVPPPGRSPRGSPGSSLLQTSSKHKRYRKPRKIGKTKHSFFFQVMLNIVSETKNAFWSPKPWDSIGSISSAG